MRDLLKYSVLLVTREHFIAACWVSSLTWEACWEPHRSRLEPKLGSSSMAKLAKCGIPLQTSCHNLKGQNGVTITSNSQPPMVLLSTHTCTLAHRHTGAHTAMLHTTFPGLTAWLGLSLQRAGLSVLEKFSSHSSEGQEHYLHLHLCQPPPPFPQPFFLSLDLSCSLCNV